MEASVDSGINVLGIDLVDEDPPCWPLQLCWKEMFLFCDEKVALVPYKRGVRKQETKRTLPELFLVVICVLVRAPAVSRAGQVTSPESRYEQEAWYWFKKNSPGRPYKMHVHAFCHKDLP